MIVYAHISHLLLTDGYTTWHFFTYSKSFLKPHFYKFGICFKLEF